MKIRKVIIYLINRFYNSRWFNELFWVCITHTIINGGSYKISENIR